MARSNWWRIGIIAALAACLQRIGGTVASTNYTVFHAQTGAAVGDQFGFSMAGLGDINADGIPDYVIGAPRADVGPNVDEGKVYVFSGADGSLIREHDGAPSSPAAGDQFGFSVAAVPDVTGDGVTDYAVGAPFNDAIVPDGGIGFLLNGATGAFVAGWGVVGVAGAHVGWSVAGMADTTGDSRGEWLIGAPDTANGAVLVVLSTGSTPVISGTGAGDRFGTAVSSAGQQNPGTDAIPDFVVGAPFDDDATPDGGSISFFSGADRSLIVSIPAGGGDSQFGTSLVLVGDLDSNGKDEIIAGGPGNDAGAITNRGFFAVLTSDFSYFFEQFGPIAGDQLGSSVATVSDLDGDGKPDYSVGSPMASPGSRVEAGIAQLFSGPSGTLLQEFDGSVDGDHLGAALGGIADLNRDGSGEVLIGAPFRDAHLMTDAGGAFVAASPSFTGYAKDTSGTPVAGVKVEAFINQSLGSDNTTADGRYAIGSLIDGAEYSVVASKAGFIPRTRIASLDGFSRRLDFTLGTISITSPFNTQTVKGFVPVTASALAEGGIAYVDFFDGATAIARDTTPPFTVSWQSIVDCANEGAHTLTALAYTNEGDAGTSLPIDVTVNNVTFPDVPCTHFAWRFVEAVARNGIAAGFPDGTYRPANNVNRGQMAVFMSRAADLTLGDFASFTPPACGSEHFSDVACTHPSYKFIEYVAAKGIASGFPDGTYKPSNGVSRGAMAVFLSRLRNLADGDFAAFSPPACGSESFPDVPCGNASYKFIEYVKSKGIAAGFPDGTYKPANIVTRGQMAVFITRAASLPF